MALLLHRRQFLQAGFAGCAAFLWGCGGSGNSPQAPAGALGPPDANGVRLPSGFTSRIVARTGSEAVPGTGYDWHGAPDGGAVFATAGGGWIYVSNCERVSGGAGALRFAADGTLIDSYSILSGTQVNCAGGRTPWNTWLSCEESGDGGQVFECDPWGIAPGIVRPALGSFNHEAAAVDPSNDMIYLTEDRSDGGLYRFVATNGLPDLTVGILQVARVTGTVVTWLDLPDPLGTTTPTRRQRPEMTTFHGGEGIGYFDGRIYFTTKGDNRLWCLDLVTSEIGVVYDGSSFLTGVDNVEISPSGDVFVAEDGGDQQIIAVTPDGSLVPVCQLVGHDGSEVTGPAFTPDASRLYFSSQRGTTGRSADGLTFEIAGPFV